MEVFHLKSGLKAVQKNPTPINLHSSLLGVTQHCIVSEFTARLPVAFLEIKVL